MKKNFKIAVISVILLAAFVLLMSLPLESKKSINSDIYVYTIPFYAKLSGFLYRDHEYKVLARQITKGLHTKEKKVLAIYRWTSENIKTDFPKGWPVIDDHPLNIIIRSYGQKDQLADVFTTLSAYAGISAFYEAYFVNDPSTKKPIASVVLSFVNVNGRWLVFDVYNRKYFLNDKGEIASVSDILKNPGLIEKCAEGFKVKGVSYPEFFETLKPIQPVQYFRPDKQMALRRILYELNMIKRRILLKERYAVK